VRNDGNGLKRRQTRHLFFWYTYYFLGSIVIMRDMVSMILMLYALLGVHWQDEFSMRSQ
jgi:hypothetical protein